MESFVIRQVFLLSETYAHFVVRQRKAVHARIESGDWEDNEGFYALIRELEELKKKTAEVHMEGEFSEEAIASFNRLVKAKIKAVALGGASRAKAS